MEVTTKRNTEAACRRMTAPTQGEVKRSEVEAEGTTLHQGVTMREPSGRAVLEEFPARGIDWRSGAVNP